MRLLDSPMPASFLGGMNPTVQADHG